MIGTDTHGIISLMNAPVKIVKAHPSAHQEVKAFFRLLHIERIYKIS